MAITIDAINLKVQVREAGGTDWDTLTCEVDSQFQHTNDITETDSKCGNHVGVKNMKGNYSGNAVFNVSPSSSELSYDEVLNYQQNKTALEMLIENEAYTAEDGSSIAEGAVVHIWAEGRFVDSTLTGSTGDVGKFSWTFKPTTIVVTGASAG